LPDWVSTPISDVPTLLRLQDAHGLPVDEQQIVRHPVPGSQRKLAHGNPGDLASGGGRRQVDGAVILHNPAGRLELAVDLDARLRLRGQV